jgi:hypothetical protein
VQEEAFRMAIAVTATALRELRDVPTVTIGTARQTSNGVTIGAVLDSQFENLIDCINEHIADNEIFNIPSTRPNHHITIARFTEVLTNEMLSNLDQLLNSFNEFSKESLLVRRLFLKRATRTPFQDIRQSIAICLAG